MSSLILRRILVFVGLIGILIVLDLSSEESLLLSIPEEVDVVQAILNAREQKTLIEQAIQDRLDQQEQLRLDRLAEEDRLLQEELQRIEEELQALENAYTLGNRDKAQDYLNLFDNSIKHTFIIEFDSAEWQGLINDMVEYNDQFGTYRSNNYRKVQVTYITDDEEFSIPDVGIRSKGNIFSRYPPVDNSGNVIPIHYVLKFNETFDTIEGTDAYNLLKTREVFDLEKLAFKWNRNYDPTYLSEVYSMQMFREVGVPAPQMSLTKFIIKIDGVIEQELLYSVQEVIDEEFIRKTLQDVPSPIVGDLYKVIWPGTLEPITNMNLVGIRNWKTNTRPVYGLETNDDFPNYQQLINLTLRLDESDLFMRKQYIETYIDVDNLIRAFAMSIFLGNPDDYRGNANNYYLYFDESGKATYIPYDFDHSLGQGWDGSPVFINYSLGNDIYVWEGTGFGSATRNIPLIDNILLDYEEYQILYEGYLEQFIVDGIFSFESFSTLFDTAQGLYGDEFDMVNNKEYYITTKIDNVLEDIEYYRNQRNN